MLFYYNLVAFNEFDHLEWENEHIDVYKQIKNIVRGSVG